MVRAAIINHAGYDDPGHIADALRRLSIDWVMCLRDEHDLDVLELGQFDLLISLGSLWSPLDATTNPTIKAELRLLARALSNGTAILGVCFGAQLLALMAGASLFALQQPEVGYNTVSFHETGLPDAHHFFWNHYGFSRPAHAKEIATGSASCWAFQVDRVLAVQFHIDATPRLLARWTVEGSAELSALEIDRSVLLEQATAYSNEAAASCHALIGQLIQR